VSEETLFELALRTPEAERSALLDRACEGQPKLRARVESLLAAHEVTSGFLDQPIGVQENTHDIEQSDSGDISESPTIPPQATAAQSTQQDAVDTVIADRYVLVEKIGEGGMGEVWVAKQTEPVKRNVALKLIKAGMDSKEVLNRFEQERQALAMMDHPNIARVLDGGLTPSRQPFFVMELVNGLPLIKFCDASKMTPRERLELFISICQAVQHAHQKGIVHRDLKPANILVTMVDGRPVPKVIDFGVAKATGGKLTEESLSTQFGAVVGTLEYMSPEQAGFSNQDVDTRSDIYSLGVILYELLTGLRPIDAKRLRSAALFDMIRVIVEEEPSKPSTRLSTDDSLPSLAALRQTEPKKLMAMLRGELDWIVMKCLEKQRDRRYETASGLARDLQRFLADEVVEARPPSWAYQARKLVVRNRGKMLAAGLVLMTLVLGLVGTGYGLQQAITARDGETAAKEKAQLQADRAIKAEQLTRKRAEELKQVADFQADMLAQIDPTKAGQELIEDMTGKFTAALVKAKVPEAERAAQIETYKSQWSKVNATDAARDFIDRTILKPAIKTIEEKIKDQPLVDAQLRQVLSKRYSDLGLYDAALPLQKTALETRQGMLGTDHPDTLSSMDAMGMLLLAKGNRSEAEPLLRDALNKRKAVLGLDHPETLASMINLGDLLREQNKLAEAEPLLLEVLQKCRRLLGEDHHQTITAGSVLAVLYFGKGKLSDAEPYSRETVEKRRRTLGDDHPSTLVAIGNLGDLLRAAGKLEEAEICLREATEKRRRVFGEEHPTTLNSINNLGVLLRMRSKPADAEPLFREILAKLRRSLGEDHPGTMAVLGNLGASLMEQGKMNEAEPLMREVIAKRQRLLGKEHPSTLISTLTLCSVLLGKDAATEAEALIVENEPRFRKVFSSGNTWQFANALVVAGKVRTLNKHFAAAEANLLEAYPLYVKTRGDNHKDTSDSIRTLVKLYAAWHQAEPGKGYDAKMTEWQKKVEANKLPSKPAEKK